MTDEPEREGDPSRARKLQNIQDMQQIARRVRANAKLQKPGTMEGFFTAVASAFSVFGKTGNPEAAIRTLLRPDATQPATTTPASDPSMRTHDKPPCFFGFGADYSRRHPGQSLYRALGPCNKWHRSVLEAVACSEIRVGRAAFYPYRVLYDRAVESGVPSWEEINAAKGVYRCES